MIKYMLLHACFARNTYARSTCKVGRSLLVPGNRILCPQNVQSFPDQKFQQEAKRFLNAHPMPQQGKAKPLPPI